MICSNEWQADSATMSQHGRQVEIILVDQRLWAQCNHVVSVTEPLVQVFKLVDFDGKPAMGFLFDAMRHTREVIFENNIWTEGILEIVDHRWRDQLHRDIHATGNL
ncbi:hypothetical protein AMTRI_Chr11g154650 [Amborella trichopoda]